MMANYCFVAPILPGGEEKLISWGKKGIMNNADHDRIMSEAGVSREQVWIQKTPMGDFAVASFETKDPQRTFEVLARSKDPWAGQFREFLKEAHGFDLTKPMDLNKQVVDWGVTERTGAYNK
jgi:hypothetical protein